MIFFIDNFKLLYDKQQRNVFKTLFDNVISSINVRNN